MIASPSRLRCQHPTRLFAGLTLAAGAAGLGYAVGVEPRLFTVRHFEVPALPAGHRPFRILHFSDLHLLPWQRGKLQWLASLTDLGPDLVVSTGDNIAHAGAITPLLTALGDLLDVPGAFVFGSNDYFSPSLRNPLRYLLPDDGRRHTTTPQLPWRELRDAYAGAGWLDLTNRTARLRVDDLDIALAGTDDAHLGYDDLAAIAGPAPHDADLRIGVTHAPYLRVLDQFAADGYEVILAGHTHGGQVCLPGHGALVTNCDLEPARAKGLHRHPAHSSPTDPGSSWLHVCAGAGASPFAPIRFSCRPEATLLTLVGR